MIRLLPWVVIAILVGVLVWARNGVTDSQEKEAIRVADTVYLQQTVNLTRNRWKTDSILLSDTVLQVDTVKVLVEAERRACDAVMSACEARVAARDQRIKSLEGGTLSLYSEAGVQFIPAPPFRAAFVGEAGLALTLDRNLHLQAAATTHGDVRLTVRRSLKLF